MEEKGLLLKRKDYLGVDEEAGSHPNRTYYFKKYSDLDNILITCSKSLEVIFILIYISLYFSFFNLLTLLF